MAETTKEWEIVRLGRRSITVLVEHLHESRTRTQIEHLLFQHELDTRFSGPNILSSLGNVFYPLVGEDADEAEMVRAIGLIEEIAKSLFESAYQTEEDWVGSSRSERDQEIYRQFAEALRADDLDLVEGRVVPFISASVDITKERGLLESRLQLYEFFVASTHLEQAVDNAARGQWEAANGQIRSFLEALCNSIASRIYQGDDSPPSQGQARKYLAAVGFLNSEESDLLKALFQVLHGQGGHAGTSSSDDCHRRLLMAVAMSNYYLDQLNGWGE